MSFQYKFLLLLSFLLLSYPQIGLAEGSEIVEVTSEEPLRREFTPAEQKGFFMIGKALSTGVGAGIGAASGISYVYGTCDHHNCDMTVPFVVIPGMIVGGVFGYTLIPSQKYSEMSPWYRISRASMYAFTPMIGVIGSYKMVDAMYPFGRGRLDKRKLAA